MVQGPDFGDGGEGAVLQEYGELVWVGAVEESVVFLVGEGPFEDVVEEVFEALGQLFEGCADGVLDFAPLLEGTGRGVSCGLEIGGGIAGEGVGRKSYSALSKPTCVTMPLTSEPTPAATAAGGKTEDMPAATPDAMETGTSNWVGSFCGVKKWVTRSWVSDVTDNVLVVSVPCNLPKKCAKCVVANHTKCASGFFLHKFQSRPVPVQSGSRISSHFSLPSLPIMCRMMLWMSGCGGPFRSGYFQFMTM